MSNQPYSRAPSDFLDAGGTRPRVIVVGGGVSGVSCAVQLSRRSDLPLDIVIVEPSAALGRGLAYAAIDDDHRLNGPLPAHAVDPCCPDELLDWCRSTGVLAADPDATLPSGHVFLRRRDFGKYVGELAAREACNAVTGSTIAHRRDHALGATPRDDGSVDVALADGATLRADMLIIATGNAPPRLLPPFRPEHAAHPRIIANPLNTPRLAEVPRDARVLVVGTGLTALDVLSTLVRQGHTGAIMAVSRRGLRPQPQPPAICGETPVESDGLRPLDRVMAELPPFIQALGPAYRLADVSRALRAEIRKAKATGGDWYAPFDLVRDAVWRIWPTIPLADKQRFLRRMRAWYDVHRFRSPPPNDRMVRQAEATGLVTFARARLDRVDAPSGAGPIMVQLTSDAGVTTRPFDMVINCTGLDATSGYQRNPFLASLVAQETLVPDGSGMGFAVTATCRAVTPTGASPNIRVVGPPSAGSHGDPLGVIYIVAQIHRIVPDILQTLKTGHAAGVRAADAMTAS
ncbi:FAD/NAD(P)-binding protein [Imbroritus primus]|uniref:FAD/NAD(P)-binding protein n=1 Tax=Imbroritus primus TaxID=3058603 RepID=UPI003D1620D4